MSKFKVGAAKTRDGRDAVVFVIQKTKEHHEIYTIVGAIKIDGVWIPQSWRLNGQYNENNEGAIVLLPNNEPMREEFGEVVKEAEICGVQLGSAWRNVVIVPNEFEGKRVKVTLEAME